MAAGNSILIESAALKPALGPKAASTEWRKLLDLSGNPTVVQVAAASQLSESYNEYVVNKMYVS